MTLEKCQFSDMSRVSLHHRTNDQTLLHIIHRNKTFSSRSDPKIRVHFIHECVLYMEKYGRPNKTTERAKMYVQQHINSFETVESHHCRRDSKNLHLPQGLSVAKINT